MEGYDELAKSVTRRCIGVDFGREASGEILLWTSQLGTVWLDARSESTYLRFDLLKQAIDRCIRKALVFEERAEEISVGDTDPLSVLMLYNSTMSIDVLVVISAGVERPGVKEEAVETEGLFAVLGERTESMRRRAPVEDLEGLSGQDFSVKGE